MFLKVIKNGYHKFSNKGAVRPSSTWVHPIWKAELKCFPTVYDNPYFVEYRHVIYRCKALELILKILKKGGAALLGVRPYWRIYNTFFYLWLRARLMSWMLRPVACEHPIYNIYLWSHPFAIFKAKTYMHAIRHPMHHRWHTSCFWCRNITGICRNHWHWRGRSHVHCRFCWSNKKTEFEYSVT